jgi:ribosomal protein S18 acetylase RimI-like enzyme
MMRDSHSIPISPAELDDAEVAAALLYSAYMHTSVTYPLPDEHESGLIERLLHFYREDGTRFSYQNIQVASQHSAVVGLVLSFGGREEARLNAAVESWLAREAEDGEWYVDALAVFKNWERQGIGTLLVHTAERQARQHHYPKIALHVAQENKHALDLYAHLHYVITRQTVLYERPYLRMVKTLNNGEPGDDGMESAEDTQRRSP